MVVSTRRNEPQDIAKLNEFWFKVRMPNNSADYGATCNTTSANGPIGN